MPSHVVVLSDTHIGGGGLHSARGAARALHSARGAARALHSARGAARALRKLPDAAYAHLDRADVILHAGDILVGEVLDELRGFAPVHAVLGNNDVELRGVLPETEALVVDGVRIAMVHDSGPSKGRARRMRRRFPEADVVVFGHSHIPWDDAGVDGQRLFNPGSPTERRSQPHHTLGTLDLDDGRVVSRIHVLG